jgi:hypothetical protein
LSGASPSVAIPVRRTGTMGFSTGGGPCLSAARAEAKRFGSSEAEDTVIIVLRGRGKGGGGGGGGGGYGYGWSVDILVVVVGLLDSYKKC